MLKTYRSLIPVMIIAMMTSCDDDDNSITTVDSYFPLESTSEWTYQRLWQQMQADNQIITSIWDTVRFKVGSDTILDGLSYKAIITQSGDIEKLVRKDGSKYFGRHHELYGTFTKEYLFLDTSLPPGASWAHIKSDGFVTKTEYIITAKNSQRTIGNKTYADVIEVEVNYYYEEMEEEMLWLTATHYYSKNAGEIYTYYPTPLSGVYSNVESILIANDN